jgi:hypothetical protein
MTHAEELHHTTLGTYLFQTDGDTRSGTRLLCAIVVQFYEAQDALRVDQVGAGLLVWVFPRNGAQKSACDLGAEKKICSFFLLSSVWRLLFSWILSRYCVEVDHTDSSNPTTTGVAHSFNTNCSATGVECC